MRSNCSGMFRFENPSAKAASQGPGWKSMKLIEQKTIAQAETAETGCYKITINAHRPLYLGLFLAGQQFRPPPFTNSGQSLPIATEILMPGIRLAKIASALRLKSLGASLLLALALSGAAIAVDPPKSEEDVKR